MVVRRQRNHSRLKPRAHSRQRRLLAHGGAPRRPAARAALRRNDLEGSARLVARWQASRLQLLPRPTVESTVADDERGRRSISDRKSTRLNSSHRCISYAVFCLKKKKK